MWFTTFELFISDLYPLSYNLIYLSALLLVLGVCAIAFSSFYLIGLREYQKEFAIGICFFIGSVGSMLIYFSGKTILLLSGAELNRKFEIVRNDNRKSMNSNDSHMSRTPSFSSDTSSPLTAADCERQITALKTSLTKILARDALALFELSSPSLKHVTSFRKANRCNPIQKNDPVCRDNQDMIGQSEEDNVQTLNSTLLRKITPSHQVHPTNIPTG